MRKLLVIALREYKAAVKTKAFVISLVLVPVLWTLSIGIQVLLHRAEDRSTKKFAIVDRTADKQVTAAIEAGLKEHNDFWVYDRETGKQNGPKFELVPIKPSASDSESILKQRFELSQRCQNGDFEGFLDIGPDVYSLIAPSKDQPFDERRELRFSRRSPAPAISGVRSRGRRMTESNNIGSPTTAFH